MFSKKIIEKLDFLVVEFSCRAVFRDNLPLFFIKKWGDTMKPMPGDVIYADRGTYKHYGIYVDQKTVIHYATDDDSYNTSNAYVHATTPKKFANGDDIYKLDFPKNESEWEELGQVVSKLTSSKISFGTVRPMPENPIVIGIKISKWFGDVIFGHGDDDNPHLFSPKETIERAKSRLGEREYSLPFNNCEHFAIWCKTGLSKSEQVDSILSALDVIQKLPIKF